jgi:PhnB protein
MEIPTGHQQVMPYLMIKGAEQFITYTQKVFDAVTSLRVDRPGTDQLMHAEITIGDSRIMFAEATDQWPVFPASLFIYVADADVAYHRALNAGGTVVMDLSDQDYGRTCGIKDHFGNVWWITTPKR